MTEQFKIAFLGTPEFAVKTLDELKKAGITPSIVITAPDKPKGRKLALTPPPVKIWADKEKIPTLQPVKLKDIYTKLKQEDWDVFILAAYGKIIPKEIINIPKHGILNIHPSLLPKYRGASPMQSAILAGDIKFGTTIMLLDEELDHGPILAQEELESGNQYPKLSELEDALSGLSVAILSKIIPLWIKGEITPRDQIHEEATYTKKIEKKDARINLDGNDEINYRKIRAFYPRPGAYFLLNKNKKPFRIIVTEASFYKGRLYIKKIKPEGKKEMAFSDFVKGNPGLISQFPEKIII